MEQRLEQKCRRNVIFFNKEMEIIEFKDQTDPRQLKANKTENYGIYTLTRKDKFR